MLISKTLKEIEKLLPAQFVRIHKSYLINSKYLKMVNTTKKIIRINISDDVLELPIGETYLEVVKNTLLTAKN
jgi:DNA-binding LytR/AlgR family response regulator